MDGGRKKVDDYETVDELIQCQTDRIKYISEVINLVHDQQYLEDDIRKAMNLIKQIKANIKQAKKEAEDAKELLIQIEELGDESSYLEKRMEYMENNLPEKFNKIVSLDDDYDKENFATEKEDTNSMPMLPTRRHLDFVETGTPKEPKMRIEQKEIQYLTQSEFNKIPSYMRGRVTYDTVNSFIDKLNKCIADKYTLLYTSRAAVKKRVDLDRITLFKRQECPKTKGRRFITHDDLKLALGGKVDKHTLNMIPMLRHTSRVQEVRDGGVIRYIAITEPHHS